MSDPLVTETQTAAATPAPKTPEIPPEVPFKKVSHRRHLLNLESTLTEAQLTSPKSPQSIFRLPCGVLMQDGSLVNEVEIREIDGEVEDMLAAEGDGIGATSKMNRLLSMTLVRLGTYTDRRILDLVPLEMTVGDRTYCLFATRRATVDDIYPYILKCPNTKCGKEDLHRVNLAHMTVKPMVDPMVREFTTRLPSSDRIGRDPVFVTWHVMTGYDDLRINTPEVKKQLQALKLKEDEIKATKNLYARVTEVGGQPVSLQNLRKLGMGDRQYLRDLFEETEGGVDTEYTFVCKYCDHTWNSDVDISQKGFFYPSAALKDWNKKSSI